MKRIALFLFLILSAITCLAQTQIDPTYQVAWNLLTGAGAPTITCTQNGNYTVYPYGAEWGQPYQDTTNNVRYNCTSTGWMQGAASSGIVPIVDGGTGATTASEALANLGGAALTGATLTGPLTGTSATFSGTVAVGAGLLDSNKLPVAPVTVPAALAIYDMRAASTTQATDITGNGNHCVFGATTHAPTLQNGTLTFDGASQQYCTTPVARSSAQTIVMAVRIPIVNTSDLVPTLFSSSDNSCPTLASFAPPGWNSVNGGVITAYNKLTSTTFDAAPLPGEVDQPVPGYAIVAVTVGTPDQWYINGQPVPWRPDAPAYGLFYSVSTSGCNTGNLRFGANLGSVNTSAPIPAADYALTGDISMAGVWSTALSASQVASVSAAFAASNQAKNYAPAPQNPVAPTYGVVARIHSIQDSRTWGAPVTPFQSYPYFLAGLLNPPELTGSWVSSIEAEPGQTMCVAADRVEMYKALYDPLAVHNAFIIWGIVNDHDATIASWTCTASLSKQLADAGFDVFIGTEIAAFSGSSATGWDNDRAAYSATVRANYKQWGAKGVIDLGENQYLGCVGCSTNLTYFYSDQVHPTNLSQSTIMPQYAAAAINAYYADNPGPPVVHGPGYSMTASDRWISVTPTTSNQIVSLPPCDGLTGSSPYYKITNSATVASGLSINATGDGLPPSPGFGIYGGAIIYAGQTLTFYPEPNATIGTGCYWSQKENVQTINSAVKNLVPDSDVKFGSAYWTVPAGPPPQPITTISKKIGAGGTNAFSIPVAASGSGMAITGYTFNLVCGSFYTFSGFIDATQVTSGGPQWVLYKPDLSTYYSNLVQVAGASGRLSQAFKFQPAACTVGNLYPVLVAANNAAAVIGASGDVLWSAPMVEAGVILDPYVSNVLDDETGYILPAALGSGTPSAGEYVDGALGVWTALPVTKSGTPTVGAGVCWKTATQLGTCTAGTWPNCSTCD